MVKCNRWTPISSDFQWPAPSVIYPDPIVTPRTDAPGTPFPFLSLPRELRDEIYAYTFPPSGLRCRYQTSRVPTRWSNRSRKPASYLLLLLTSHQIHDEAQATLLRTCTVEIVSRYSHRNRYHHGSSTVHGIMRMFPSAQAGLVSVVCMQYGYYTPLYLGETGKEIDQLFAMWEYMVSEAYILRECFPRLRRFGARYLEFEMALGQRFFQRLEHVDESDRAARQVWMEERAQVLVEWMKSWVQGKGLVPPPWLKIELPEVDERPEGSARCVRFQQDALDLAHRLFAKERLVTQDELDESGRKWLEEWSAQRKRKRKKWQKTSVDM
ncbi:hypothetical protein BU25DRAFT_414511 [Macroventuria anomochaeta]|uniref:Uncharacterized protein n=1 Tax=Macroventuria anomochaeta TaxID=301207 RepID=A0ACB6RMU4_9PLEO|nr:uncharacterized protein BU25DRAFT_414511 [Macroventuria anomochaeta]KAF2623246.1 hypothetical protein BU25DRAFT_414511 [Macroventuria anomochaeta]